MAAYDWRVIYRNSDNTADTDTQVPSALTNKFAILGQRYPGQGSASWYYLKSNQFIVDTSAIGGSNNYDVSIDLSSMNWRDLGVLSDAMDAKCETSRTINGHDLTADVVITKADLGIKRQETYSGTSNSSGLYTVTFGTAYSVAPNVQANIINGTDTQTIRITAVSTTGFTVLVRNRTDVIGLLPSYANVNGVAVDVVVTEK